VPEVPCTTNVDVDTQSEKPDSPKMIVPDLNTLNTLPMCSASLDRSS